MEDNLHEDKLDDYVRRSFEGHEEAPPEDMWLRVEADMKPSESGHPPRRAWAWRVLSIGAIVLLLSMLVCEHLYYEGKIKALQVQESLDSGTEKRLRAPIATEPSRAEQSTRPAKVSEANANARAVLKHLPKTPVSESQKTSIPTQSRSGVANNQTEWGVITEVLAEPNQSIQDGSAVVEQKDAEFPAAIGLDWVATRNTAMHRPTTPKLLKTFPIKPRQKPSGWSVGASVAMLRAIEQQHTPKPRLGRPAFVSEREREGLSWVWGIGIGKKLSNSFSLESGIAYQAITQSAAHTARFRFRDGTPIAVRRNFEYDLSTYGGTAAVSLRMETTPGAPPSDDEPVVLKITTEHQIEMLRIPLLAKFEYGKGRLTGHVKAGVLGNVVVRNELDILARTSQNTRFQSVSGADGYTVQLNKGRLFWGYWLSAGAEYHLGQRFDVFAEPMLLGDFPRTDQQRRSLPKRVAYGLNVGARLNF